MTSSFYDVRYVAITMNAFRVQSLSLSHVMKLLMAVSNHFANQLFSALSRDWRLIAGVSRPGTLELSQWTSSWQNFDTQKQRKAAFKVKSSRGLGDQMH